MHTPTEIQAFVWHVVINRHFFFSMNATTQKPDKKQMSFLGHVVPKNGFIQIN